jgi:hypothetical protein
MLSLAVAGETYLRRACLPLESLGRLIPGKTLKL